MDRLIMKQVEDGDQDVVVTVKWPLMAVMAIMYKFTILLICLL